MYDLKIFYIFNNLAGKSAVFDALVIFFSDYFQYIVLAAFLIMLFFVGYSNKEKIKIFLVTFISISIARLGIVSLIRLLYHRPRPFLTYQVHQLISENDWSFPSGHAAFFFAMATAIYLYTKSGE